MMSLKNEKNLKRGGSMKGLTQTKYCQLLRRVIDLSIANIQVRVVKIAIEKTATHLSIIKVIEIIGEVIERRALPMMIRELQN